MSSKLSDLRKIVAENRRLNSGDNKVVYLQVDADSSYFDIRHQIFKKNNSKFVDSTLPSVSSNKNSASGFFSHQKNELNLSEIGDHWEIEEIISDKSGNNRKILSKNIDPFISSSFDLSCADIISSILHLLSVV